MLFRVFLPSGPFIAKYAAKLPLFFHLCKFILYNFGYVKINHYLCALIRNTPMMKLRFAPGTIGSLFVMIALMIVIASVLYTNHLARQLQDEETRKVQLWADATRQFISADEGTDLNLVLSIIEGNTTIPVYMLDADGQVLDTRNVVHPVDDPSSLNGPIELRIDNGDTPYIYRIYYDESTLLTRLRWFPYLEFGIILLFVLVAIISLYTAQRAEQNRVWAGLSKETAHQLGTPISSLMAWQALLQSRYPDEPLIPMLQSDIDRLHTIADRFSKIGSLPELQRTNLSDTLSEVVSYMQKRISDRVTVTLDIPEQECYCMLSAPLFSWVVENIMKNAVDAMNGVGTITLALSCQDHHVVLDITDTGRGIERRLYRTIFRPGYTSKQRGWGLGLSLSKRIVEQYHRGRLFVKSSQVGVGTTFRILLPQAKDGTSAS